MDTSATTVTGKSRFDALLGYVRSSGFVGFVISVAVIAIVSVIYFYPDAFEGNELRQHDMQQGIAIGQEAKAFHEETGETTRWTNSLFSGMPNFQISPTYPSNGLINWLQSVYQLGLPAPSNLVFIMMTGFFILLIAMRVRWYLALFGALAYGFSSYFFIIIGAGHIWKFVTLAYVPPTVAGMVLCYRGRYLAGGAVAALFATLQIAANHIQMSYYFLMIVVGFAVAYCIILYRKGRMTQWLVATGTLVAAAVLAVTANSPSLYYTYEYSKETMRGNHSELSDATSASGVNKSGGLDKDYITAWSYGIDETMTLLIPNVKGGATIKPEKGDNKLLSLYDTDAAQALVNSGQLHPDLANALRQLPQYFGDQPMTNGPVYVGALIVALFLLGCFIVKGPIKWMLVVVTAISVALSWGHNMMWLTDMMIDHFPMYNKFRTVASILVVAEFTMPLLAVLALRKLLNNRNDWKQFRTPLAVSFGLCMAFCALGIISPGVFGSYLSAQESEAYVASGMAMQYPELFAAIEKVRMSMVSADALRSFIVVGVGAGLLLLYFRRKMGTAVVCVLLAVVTVADLYTVNKRYINHDSFMPKRLTQGAPFAMTDADRQILADTAMNYRVMNVPQFSQAGPSYYHKAIGGYHAAKLTRYQDIIDRHLTPILAGKPSEGDMNVLNMLNGKYLVMSDNEVYVNPDALGNAWLVDRIVYADNADAEMATLDSINPAVTAVSDARFRDVLGTSVARKMPGDTIYETTYAPNRLTYHVDSHNGGLAVFSEVYFPWGWKAWIDGTPAEIGRVDYLLRAMKVPAGVHMIEMRFDPDSLHTTVTAACCAIIIIYLALACALVVSVLRITRPRHNERT